MARLRRMHNSLCIIFGLATLCFLDVQFVARFTHKAMLVSETISELEANMPALFHSNAETTSANSGTQQYESPETRNRDNALKGRTKIVAFASNSYRIVAANWHERFKALGYDTQTVIAVDNATVAYMIENGYQYETRFQADLPEKYHTLRYQKKLQLKVQQLFADRWVYILEQLEKGIHVLLTDVDNIFSRYVPMSDFEKSEYDVFHAYETKHPMTVFNHMGFVVCGGMSWWRSDPRVIQFVRLMVEKCGPLCDDQKLLNILLAWSANMTWHHTPETQGPTARRVQSSDKRYDGLLERGLTGTSGYGYRVKVWDRDFAFRGGVDPKPCPKNNWVSMPVVEARVRARVWLEKLNAFEQWDQNCGGNNTLGILVKPDNFNKLLRERQAQNSKG